MVLNDSGSSQGAAVSPTRDARVPEEPQTTRAMTPPIDNAALVPKGISPYPMLHVSKKNSTEIAHQPVALYPSKTTNIASESPVSNAQSRAPIVVEEIGKTPVKPEEMGDAEKRSRILKRLRQAQAAAPEPSEKRSEAEIDKYPGTAEQAQAELEQRLNTLLKQEEEHGDLAMPVVIPEHADQTRTEREKSEVLLKEKEKQEGVATGENLLPSIEQAQAELEQRRRILLEKMEKQADVSKSDGVLAQAKVIPASEARSGQIKEYTGGNVQEYDGSAPDRKVTSTEQVEAELKEFFDKMAEKVNAAPIGSSASQLPPRPPTTEGPSFPTGSPPPDYDTHGNPIPRTPKRALGDEHANGTPKKPKTMSFASSSNVIPNQTWRKDSAPRAPHNSIYHSRGSQQYHGSQTYRSSGYGSGTPQPYHQTQPSSAARPYSYAQYPAPIKFSGSSHGYLGSHSYPHAYYSPTALASGSHGPYNVQQYTGRTAGAGLHYSGAPIHRAASTYRGGTNRGSQNPPGREEQGRYDSNGRR
jgi:hypothetical protein